MNVIWTKAIDIKLMEDLKDKFDSFHYIKRFKEKVKIAIDVTADPYLVTSSSAIEYAKENFGDEYFKGKKLVCFGKKQLNCSLITAVRLRGSMRITGKSFFT